MFYNYFWLEFFSLCTYKFQKYWLSRCLQKNDSQNSGNRQKNRMSDTAKKKKRGGNLSLMEIFDGSNGINTIKFYLIRQTCLKLNFCWCLEIPFYCVCKAELPNILIFYQTNLLWVRIFFFLMNFVCVVFIRFHLLSKISASKHVCLAWKIILNVFQLRYSWNIETKSGKYSIWYRIIHQQ